MVAAVAAALVIVSHASAQDDLADVREKTYRLEADRKLRYTLIGAATPGDRPAQGYKLLVVLPGGDGGDGFTPFVKRIFKYALSDDYLIVQPLAPKWNKQQKIVWPTAGSPTRGVKVPTEEFIRLAVEDVAGRAKVDRRCTFALGWSSGGPAVYAASMTEGTPITGTFAAMSVFHWKDLTLENASGHAYYVLHSEADQVCPFWMARKAAAELPRHGAKAKLQTYAGGHGWRGDVFGNITAGIEWLEENASLGTTVAVSVAE
ncbi:MAG: hypothetical protein AAGF31_02975 [Planctomycetota bacterium]